MKQHDRELYVHIRWYKVGQYEEIKYEWSHFQTKKEDL